jgi:hypothetical protein
MLMPELDSRRRVPRRPKYVFASPQFSTPFHDEPQVRMLVYSEAETTDFAIASLDVFRLVPLAHPRATP